MPARRDPLEDVDRLFIDGSNLLGALTGSPEGPPAALLGRLRGALPAELRVEIVFDGPADRSPVGRVATGVTVRYSGRRDADATLIDLASTAGLAALPPGSNVLVVTDDRGLAIGLRKHGVRTIGTAWLVRRLGRRAPGGIPGSAPGRSVAPRPLRGSSESGRHPLPHDAGGPEGGADADRPAADGDASEDRPRWTPGRHATRKVGAAKKAPRRRGGGLGEARPWKRRRRPAG